MVGQARINCLLGGVTTLSDSALRPSLLLFDASFGVLIAGLEVFMISLLRTIRRSVAVLLGAGLLFLATPGSAKDDDHNRGPNPNAPGHTKKGTSVPELGVGAAGAGLVVAVGALLVMGSRRRKRSA